MRRRWNLLATESRRALSLVLLLAGVLALTVYLSSRAVTSAAQPHPQDNELWQWQAASPSGPTPLQRAGQGVAARRVRLNRDAAQQALEQAPREFAQLLGDSKATFTLPLPDGSFATFRVEESSVMERELAEQFAEIKSYRGVAIDRAAMTMRCDLTPQGLHATILTGAQIISVHPESDGGAPSGMTATADYITYEAQGQGEYQCLVRDAQELKGEFERNQNLTYAVQSAVGGQLRNFRIAIATTTEFSSFYGGGSVSGTVSALNTWLNAANAIYEREVSVHMNLVNNTNIIYIGSDPFTNGDASAMLDQVRGVMRDVVGTANYDIGHVLGYTPGSGAGIAFVKAVCNNSDFDGKGPIKGGGASNISGAAGNAAFLGLWAHELGHQFGANHSYNGTAGGCGSRNPSTAWEPGSGSTLMSYAGICDSDNLSGGRENRFHAGSFEEIVAHLNSVASCPTNTATGNNVPTVSGGGNRTIPKFTPFALTGAGSDADAGDLPNLTYAWDEIDAGGSFSNPPYNDAGDPAGTTRPLFRSFPPTASPTRLFPSLTYILNNANDPPDTSNGAQTAEELPRVGRTLNFKVTVRDQRGGVNNDQVTLTVDGNSGPFVVTAPNAATTWTGGQAQTVTWDVSNTNNAPVSCANVRITLSADGGNTFPYVLAASTPNDGSETIAVPFGVTSSTARVKVEAVGNVFFDISNANITVTQNASCSYSISPTSQTVAAGGGTVGVTVTTQAGCNWSAVSNAAWITTSSSGIGSGTAQLAVAANAGGARTGTATIAGQTFTVNQSAACSFSISPTSDSLGTGGGTGSISVTTTSGCAWTAVSNAGWITITSGASGTGSGTVNYSVAANTSLPRTGTLTVAGQTVTITQAGSTAGLQYYQLARPVRLLDTRAGAAACYTPGAPLAAGSTRTQTARGTCDSLTIPSTALAIVGNATVVSTQNQSGYITLYSADAALPNASNLNFLAGQVVPNAFTVGLDSSGRFNITTSAATDFIVDVTGYYAPPASGGLYFHPLAAPVRLLDTRPDPFTSCISASAPLTSGSTTTLLARGTCAGIPATAKAIVGNATVVSTQGQSGFMTLFASGAVPNASNLNFMVGQVVPNSFTVGLDASGNFRVYTSNATDLIIDVAGYYDDQSSGGLLFYPLSAPGRWLDTRPDPFTSCVARATPIGNGETFTVQAEQSCGGLTIPPAAQAVLGNATVVSNQGASGYITLWPTGAAQPNASNLNYVVGQVVPNAFVVGLDASGRFNLSATGATDLIIDLSGYFAP